MIDRVALKALVVEALREVLAEERARSAPEPTDGYITPEQAEERGLCSSSHARRACREGRVPALRAGRCWRFRTVDLEAALKATPSTSGEPNFDELARERLARRAGGGQ